MKIVNFLCIVSFLFTVNFVSSLFILNKNSKKQTNIEDKEKNNVEKIWSGIQLMLSILMLWLILLSMDFDMYSKKLFKLLCLICIITTSIGWDYFGRQDKKIERGIFVFLTFFCIYIFIGY